MRSERWVPSTAWGELLLCGGTAGSRGVGCSCVPCAFPRASWLWPHGTWWMRDLVLCFIFRIGLGVRVRKHSPQKGEEQGGLQEYISLPSLFSNCPKFIFSRISSCWSLEVVNR